MGRRMGMPQIPTVRSSTHPLDLAAAARDAWPATTLAFWQGTEIAGPDRVFWPRDPDEVLAVLQAAAGSGTPVVPYGAGSGVCGGAAGKPGTIVLDLKRLDAIGPLDTERWVVRCEAGVLGQHLEDWLNARGFTLGHSPSSIWCSTVGGWAAARSAGQFSSRYGVFEDMVLAIDAVAPARGRFRVGEGGDAPDAWLPLILGSEGTLAVITAVELRVWPLPEKRWLRGYKFPDVASAIRAMRALMQGELWPSVVRLYDPVDTRIGGRTKKQHPDATDAHHRKFYQDWLDAIDAIPAIRRHTIGLPLRLPGLVNTIFDGIVDGCLVVVGWEGAADVVDAVTPVGHAILTAEGEDLGEEPGQRWYDNRHGVSFKLMPIFERGGFADTMEVAVRWSDLERLYHEVRSAVRRYGIVMAHMSHVYPEGGSIYFSFAGHGDVKRYHETWNAAFEAVLRVGGTVTHHHGVGALKAAAASAEIGPAIAGWRSIKATLDPAAILNPGRLFVDVPHRAPPHAPPASIDGLAESAWDATLAERQTAAAALDGEVMWPFERLPGPPRWQRPAWMVGWSKVSGELAGQACALGRGPRSAAGCDLRDWLVTQDLGATATFPISPAGDRWMGEATVSAPWQVARHLLRRDLRPSVLAVVAGRLRVGFRGPCAEKFGSIASAHVPGGLTPIAYDIAPIPSGPLVACDDTDARAAIVAPHGAWRPVNP
jgi:alkyldihydroxyacetonephosphate synthase